MKEIQETFHNWSDELPVSRIVFYFSKFSSYSGLFCKVVGKSLLRCIRHFEFVKMTRDGLNCSKDHPPQPACKKVSTQHFDRTSVFAGRSSRSLSQCLLGFGTAFLSRWSSTLRMVVRSSSISIRFIANGVQRVAQDFLDSGIIFFIYRVSESEVYSGSQLSFVVSDRKLISTLFPARFHVNLPSYFQFWVLPLFSWKQVFVSLNFLSPLVK